MPQRTAGWYGASTSSRMLTTLLTSGWGLCSAYIFFHALLVSHDPRPSLVAFIPLVIVWATLERKRWGRLAMLGLSSTSLGLFVAGIGYVAAFDSQPMIPAAKHDLIHYSQQVLQMYYGAPKAAYVTLILAATTGFWMRLPAVVAEFERGKRATLARAQRAIAYSLVGCWAITVMLTSFSPNKSQLLNAPAKRRLHDGKPKHNPARHASLSAAVLTDV